jgi:hypothetical protein
MKLVANATVNTAVFVVLYILFMLPTYFLPYLGSNSFLVGAVAAADQAYIHLPFWFHALSLGVLIALAWFRGAFVEKKWLVIFPVLGAVFDMVPGLNSIPLVPTVMHLLAIILGVTGSPAVANNGQTTSRNTIKMVSSSAIGVILGVVAVVISIINISQHNQTYSPQRSSTPSFPIASKKKPVVVEPTENDLIDQFKIGFLDTNFGKFYQITSVQTAKLLNTEKTRRNYQFIFTYSCKPNISNCNVANKQGYLNTLFAQSGHKWSLIEIQEEN